MMKFPTEWKVIKFHGSKPPKHQFWISPNCPTSSKPMSNSSLGPTSFTKPQYLPHWVVFYNGCLPPIHGHEWEGDTSPDSPPDSPADSAIFRSSLFSADPPCDKPREFLDQLIHSGACLVYVWFL